jgi:hypothetical protein
MDMETDFIGIHPMLIEVDDCKFSLTAGLSFE